MWGMFDDHILSYQEREAIIMNKKSSGKKLATQASKIMRSNNSSKIQKSLAASVLSQRSNQKITGKIMETKASTVVNSNKYSDVTKIRSFLSSFFIKSSIFKSLLNEE